ncbi:uncharacterized protein NPIL_247121 [Nephila pilipes]|uniref:Gustatory receptor n=1 Tax=Nephila pilipes TaxID=299642 RepID=A0A8X6PH17_NEPPI|nr:uncharacterized protein NPIL_247121 [Nephila pilipes]
MPSNSLKTTHVFMITSSLLVTCALPVFLSPLLTYLENGNIRLNKYFALQYHVQEEKYRTMVNLAGEYMYRTVRVQYPCLVALSICVLVYRYSVLLFRLNNGFKNIEFITVPESILKLRNDYNKIERKLHDLKDILSTSLFLILIICFCDLYVALSFALQKELMPFLLSELYCNAFSGTVVLFSLTIFGAKIPEYMMEIKTTVRFLRDKYEFGCAISRKEIRVLNRIIKKDIIYLTAGGFIDFKKNFLLTALGTMFTYGLLIISFNRS